MLSTASMAARLTTATRCTRIACVKATRRDLTAATIASAMTLSSCQRGSAKTEARNDQTHASARATILEMDALMSSAYAQTSQYARQVRMRPSECELPPFNLERNADAMLAASKTFEHAMCFIVYGAELRGVVDKQARQAWVRTIRERVAALRFCARACHDMCHDRFHDAVCAVPSAWRAECNAVLDPQNLRSHVVSYNATQLLPARRLGATFSCYKKLLLTDTALDSAHLQIQVREVSLARDFRHSGNSVPDRLAAARTRQEPDLAQLHPTLWRLCHESHQNLAGSGVAPRPGARAIALGALWSRMGTRGQDYAPQATN